MISASCAVARIGDFMSDEGRKKSRREATLVPPKRCGPKAAVCTAVK